jgi:Tol biopolymer transport system component/tRNA A-37 threonylcarbamoyl transferase component Bud32
MPLSAGDRLGAYEIISELGAGGNGEVWKARDTRLDRIVALKVSKREFSERFEREARAVAALNHPHICQIYDIGPNYLVMEYVDGAPLQGPLPLDRVAEYADQILDALDAAHKKGITHRDLKPANILVSRAGIKLLDFGLAKHAGPLKETDATLTQPITAEGEIVGTLQYMSPEQLQGKEADARSDLFSFGCVLYETLTGRRPFEGANAATVIAAILDKDPAPLPVAPALERVVRTCLNKDPGQRYQTALEVQRALHWAFQQREGGAWRSRGWWTAIAAALVIGALLGAAGGWAVWRLRPSPAEEHALRFDIAAPGNGRFTIGAGSGGIALSPDGQTAAFVATLGERSGLWVRTIDGTVVRPLLGTEGAYSPFWSPDSKSIAFFAEGKLRRIDLASPAPTTICDTVVPGRGGAWTNDGRILFSVLASPLLQVPASGGMPTALTKFDPSNGDAAHYWPQVLPGGNFLYLAQSAKLDSSGVYAASLANPNSRVRLVATDTNAIYAPGYLLWMRGSTLMAQPFDAKKLKLSGDPAPVADPVGKSAITGRMNVAASGNGLLLYSASGSNQLTWLDRTGQPQGTLGEPNDYVIFRISPDGRRVAAAIGSPTRADLWLLDVQRGVSSRFTFTGTAHSDPVWSADGSTIVYRGRNSIFRKDSSGAGEEQRMTQSTLLQSPTDWSRDGRTILFNRFSPGTASDLWVLPVTPEGNPTGQPQAYLHTQFNEQDGQFSPETNPRWVAYTSNESGQQEVYVQAFPEARGKFQVSAGGGRFPRWGPASPGISRELFYVSLNDKLMAAALKFGKDSVEPAAPRELFALPTPTINFIPYDASADGERFLVQAPPQQAPPLSVIVNWPVLVKGR